ncbi:unnamed protein product [Cuscuta campestris]|uniref:Uncharacterized protein n=1 Tax=Cuscuta campestris TaxID=132261 RepID=A0A484LWU0_9ASTE|nr:unnamed protein product [Cuscuta campestris]
MGLSKFGICRILASHRCFEITHRCSKLRPDGSPTHRAPLRLVETFPESARTLKTDTPSKSYAQNSVVTTLPVDCWCAAVTDEVGDPKLSDDHSLVVEDPIIAAICCYVVTAGGQPCDPSEGSQINLYVVEIDATVNGVPVPAEIGVEGSHKGGIDARAASGDERPQTRCLKLVLEVVVPLLLRVQLGQHPRRRNGTLGKVREEPVEFLLRPELQEGSVQVWKGLRRRARSLSGGLLLRSFCLLSSGHDLKQEFEEL